MIPPADPLAMLNPFMTRAYPLVQAMGRVGFLGKQKTDHFGRL